MTVHAVVLPVSREEFQENGVEQFEKIQDQCRYRDGDETEIEFFKEKISAFRQAQQHRQKTEKDAAEKQKGGKRSREKRTE